MFAKSAIMTQKYQYGFQKNAEFYTDFNFVDAGFRNARNKS